MPKNASTVDKPLKNKSLENLKKRVKFTSKTAKKASILGVKAKKANFDTIKAFRTIFDTIVKTPKAVASDALEAGLDAPKKCTMGEVAFISAFADAINSKNYKALEALAKMAGKHFDQSADALGGSNNPMNVTQSTAITPAAMKNIADKLDGLC